MGKICSQCGNRFALQDSRRIYCGMVCAKIGRGKNRRRRIDRECVFCKKIFTVPRCRVLRKGRGNVSIYCSVSCKHKDWLSNGGPRTERSFLPYVDKSGYVFICDPKHPLSIERRKRGKRNNRLREHRLVMERHIGRVLEKWETVHHKNGIKTDNRIENLELWSKSHPSGQRISDLRKRIMELENELSIFRKEIANGISQKNVLAC